MSATIYQDIWDVDQTQNGVPAVRKGEPTALETGYVIVDEPAGAVSGEHRVLADVKIPEYKRKTYTLCERLFNNYFLDPGIRELVTAEESQEEREFIDAIVPLKPLQVAKEFIEQELGRSISDSALADMIKETWFFQGKSGSKHASGFEHVFVGEQSKVGDQPDHIATTMGGYHFWYKYYLDDAGHRLPATTPGQDRIVYRGTRYSGADDPAKGLLVPEVVTLSFEWTAPDFTGGPDQLLQKPIGGFWVGCSPECLIALGLVRCRTKAGKMAKINGATYQLDLHRLSDNAQSIRTFFPRFINSEFVDITPPEPVKPAEPAEPAEPTEPMTVPPLPEGDVRIIAALVNVPGDEAGRETVTLINTTPQAIILTRWAVQAPNGWRFVFADVELNAGESRTFRMPASTPQFRNKAGEISLFDNRDLLHHQVSYSNEDAKREGYTIVF